VRRHNDSKTSGKTKDRLHAFIGVNCNDHPSPVRTNRVKQNSVSNSGLNSTVFWQRLDVFKAIRPFDTSILKRCKQTGENDILVIEICVI